MEQSKTLPIIVGGFYRSGTSLVRRLLDGHSRIHCGPEVKFFKDLYGDYLDDPLAHVRLFSTILSLGITQNEVENIFGQAFITAHELAAQKLNKPRWADKNPENVLYLKNWQNVLPTGFVFIHVIRHPFDVLASLQEIGFPKTVPLDFEGRVRFLKTFVEAGLEYEKRHPKTSFQIRYEALVANPSDFLTQLFNWLGEEFEPQVLNNFNHPDRKQGIEDPKVVNTTAVHNESVERWQSDLTFEQVRIARHILGSSFAGYEL